MKTLIESTRRDGVMSKGEWRGLTRWGNGAIHSVLVCCPKCGKTHPVVKQRIDPDGRAYPSLVCPFTGCDFHEFVKLADWKA